MKHIKGVAVDTNSSDIKACKSVEDLKKLEIFSHLSEEDQDEANDELWSEIKPKN